jgi:hypothetical protein
LTVVDDELVAALRDLAEPTEEMSNETNWVGPIVRLAEMK